MTEQSHEARTIGYKNNTLSEKCRLWCRKIWKPLTTGRAREVGSKRPHRWQPQYLCPTRHCLGDGAEWAHVRSELFASNNPLHASLRSWSMVCGPTISGKMCSSLEGMRRTSSRNHWQTFVAFALVRTTVKHRVSLVLVFLFFVSGNFPFKY